MVTVLLKLLLLLLLFRIVTGGPKTVIGLELAPLLQSPLPRLKIKRKNIWLHSIKPATTYSTFSLCLVISAVKHIMGEMDCSQNKPLNNGEEMCLDLNSNWHNYCSSYVIENIKSALKKKKKKSALNYA